MSREALVLLVCCCDFRDGAERLISSKSLRNAVIRAFPGLFRILRMCAPRRAAAVVRPRGREKSADRRRRILISRLLIIRASVPRRKSPFPAYFKGFPAVSPLIPPYPAFLKYPVSPHFPNPCRRAAHQSSSLFSILSSLAQPRPSRPASREGQRTALRRGGGSVPRQQCGTAKRPFPRTAPHAGHRLILNPCRRAALRNYSLFTLLYSLSQPCPLFPPGRTAKQKYILFFGHLTHNSTRYNTGLNLIMEGKEYGKTGSA